MDDNEIIDLFWQRSEDALAECKSKFGGYCRTIANNIINNFLRSEPPSNGDIFVKRYWYLQSVKEIAAEYGYSESKTASLLFRMRERLKQNLESEGFLL
jgi:RNA polymerase sigma-70 factor (ECF subfamily)